MTGQGKHSSRPPAPDAVPVRRAATDLRELLASTMEVMREQAAALDVELRIETTDAVPARVSLDPEKTAWAVATLVGNAFRYVRRGTRRMPGGSIVVGSDYDAARRQVVIRVEDDGPGIPKDKLPWLFKRAAGRPHAAGLGLLLIHDVVAAHGGTVAVESHVDGPQRGTAVTLRIPVG